MGFFRRSNDGRHFVDALLKIIKKRPKRIIIIKKKEHGTRCVMKSRDCHKFE